VDDATKQLLYAQLGAGRALARLGIEHILGYSPQARGRSKRVNRTLQDRLVNELRVAGIATLAVANRYLRDRFIPDFNAEFGCPPRERRSAFVRIGAVDLEQILCVWNTSASSVATTSSPRTRCPCSSASSAGGAPVQAFVYSSGAISMVTTPPGTAPAASAATTGTANPCRPELDVTHPSGHFTVSNSCGQITYQQQVGRACLDTTTMTQ